MSNVIYRYTDDDALRDGIFVEVTPQSLKTRVIVTPRIKEAFSMAAIMEMYASFGRKFNNPAVNTDRHQNFYAHEKMNGQTVVVTTCILTSNEGGDDVAVKLYFLDEE